MTDSPWCAVPEPQLRFWSQQVNPVRWACVVGKERKRVLQVLSKGSRAGRAQKAHTPWRLHGKFKAQVKERVICSGTLSWLAGGEVIGTQHHHLLVLTSLEYACLWSLQSTSPPGGGFRVYKTAQRSLLRILSTALEEGHRSLTLVVV